MRKPKPKTVKVVCDMCGIEWAAHKLKPTHEPTLEECVRVLKAELAKRPTRNPYLSNGVTLYGTGVTS
jgi:hypothetical protein